jgi:hypothetical protein
MPDRLRLTSKGKKGDSNRSVLRTFSVNKQIPD